MRLKHPFVKLPLNFDHAKLAEETGRFSEDEWRDHPQGFEGNSSLILVSSNGEENDFYGGPMKPASRLERAPLIRQVMGSFNTVIGRSRLMRLAPGASVLEHTDANYFWRNHMRIHIPIVTDPGVAFFCDGEQVHMAAGESWTFDNWRMHSVMNNSDITRIHLVIDTVGSSDLWQMIDGRRNEAIEFDFDSDSEPSLQFEEFRGLPVIPPAELRNDLEILVDDVADRDHVASAAKQQAHELTEDFLHDWQSTWMIHGTRASGLPHYQKLVDSFRQSIEGIAVPLELTSNGYSFKRAVFYTLEAALTPANFSDEKTVAVHHSQSVQRGPDFDRPVFIVAAPRSGSTLLFETLAVNREFWSVGDESHKHFERIASLRPNSKNLSNRLKAEMATPEVVETLIKYFVADLVNAEGVSFDHLTSRSRPEKIRFLEKTPKNALRIPFILQAFPDARFIFLFRDAKQNVSSLMDSWRSGQFVTYSDLPGWPRNQPWSHLLIPGWQKLRNSRLAEITATQWALTNQIIMTDLGKLPSHQWCAVEYDSLLANTMDELKRLCDFAQVVCGPKMKEVASKPLKPSKYTLTAPGPDKWKLNEADMKGVIPATEQLMAALRELV